MEGERVTSPPPLPPWRLGGDDVDALGLDESDVRRRDGDGVVHRRGDDGEGVGRESHVVENGQELVHGRSSLSGCLPDKHHHSRFGEGLVILGRKLSTDVAVSVMSEFCGPNERCVIRHIRLTDIMPNSDISEV